MNASLIGRMFGCLIPIGIASALVNASRALFLILTMGWCKDLDGIFLCRGFIHTYVGHKILMVPPGHTVLLEKRHFVLDLRVIPKKESKLPVNHVNSYFVSVLQIIAVVSSK